MATEQTIGLEDIQVVSPYQVVRLTELRITRKANNHAYAYFSVIIPEDERDNYVGKNVVNDRIKISQAEGGRMFRTLFTGLITEVRIKTVRNIYYLEIQALSSTYELDIKLKKRSFQNHQMRYDELFREVLEDYQGADCNDQITGGAMLKKFTMQYEETDWQFLKRMASRFGAMLIPDATQDRPKFWLGLPEGKEAGLEDFHFTVSKNLVGYEMTHANYDEKVIDTDYVGYEVESSQVLNIGDRVKFHGINLVIAEATAAVQKGTLKHTYYLTSDTGLRQDPLYNQEITGGAIRGTVLDRQNDRVKVHLEMDKSQNNEEACWFPVATSYTAEGNSGWYCMPEPGDEVQLQFPNFREEHALVTRAIRKDGVDNSKIVDPDIKYFGNTHGKELRMDADQLKFSAKEEKVNKMVIKLDGEAGVEIQSDRSIRMESAKDLSWDASQIKLRAGLGIYLVCDASSLILNGEVNGKSSTASLEGHVKNSGGASEEPAPVRGEKAENSGVVVDSAQIGIDIDGSIPGVSLLAADTVNENDFHAGLDVLGTIPIRSGGPCQ